MGHGILTIISYCCADGKKVSQLPTSLSLTPLSGSKFGDSPSDEVGRELGNSLGKFIESDRRARQIEQAKFMRIRVDLQLDKPLRCGGKVASADGEKFWVNFKYERLPTFCFHCGILGHDDKHCLEITNQQNSSKQYGDWLRAQGNSKWGREKSRSTNNEGRSDGNEDRVEENIQTTAKNSYASAANGGEGGEW